MPKILAALVLMLVLTCPNAFANKIGVINMQEIVTKSEAGSQAMEKLKTSFESMKTNLDKRRDEIQKMRDDLQKQSMALSQEAKQDKEMDFKRKVRDFQDLFQDYQTKMKAEEDRLSKPIIELVVATIRDYGQKNAFTMIVDSQNSGLLYFDKSIDLTNIIVTEVNKAWHDKSGKAGTATKPKK